MRPPLRLGATSFVHPAGWLDNARRLAERVDDVEILLFESDAASLPGGEEIAALALLAAERSLTYTVHLPLDVSLASEDPARRAYALAAIDRAIAVATPLRPHAWVAHVYLGDREHDTPPRDLVAWRRRATVALATLVERGLPPSALCIETLDYDPALLFPIVEELGLSLALDVGHLARDGRSLAPLLDRHLQRTRVIQWHGVDPTGRDHRSLRFYPRPDALTLLRRLHAARYAGVVTLEVFSVADLDDSLTCFAELTAELATEVAA